MPKARLAHAARMPCLLHRSRSGPVSADYVSSTPPTLTTTFNTNSLKLPLSVIVGINNIKATFLIAYYYITLKLAASFK